jgi:ATP adenylyltransferase
MVPAIQERSFVMDYLWAPWRIEYIEMGKPAGCILCDKPDQSDDAGNLILCRGEQNFIIMNRYPYNAGHLMVAPYRHLATPEDFTDDELSEHYGLVRKCLGVLREVFHPAGFNLGMNLGRAAGAGIEGHAHTHIVPRWSGDTNFMPVLSGVKVVSEAITETYRRLEGQF